VAEAMAGAADGLAGPGDDAGERAAVRRGRIAVAAIFFLHGAVNGVYAGRLPWIQQHIHATPGVLGAALVTMTLGAMTAAPATGLVIRRFGARNGMRLLIALWTALIALPALMPNAWTLAATLLVLGAAAGCTDVAMNAHGVRIERRARKPIMSGLHGTWSTGMIVGSAAGGVCAYLGIGAPAESAVAALVLTLLTIPACALLPSDHAAAAATAADAEAALGPAEPPLYIAPARYSLPTQAVLLIGVVTFLGVFAEGSSDSWSAVFLTHVDHASTAIGAFCVSAFSAAMAAGRLSGDALVRRLGPVTVVRVGGLVALAGACLVVASRGPALGVVGFALLGMGIANVVPLAIAATGRLGGDADSAIASITTIVYAGGLAAGPVIGGLGSAVSLPFGFAVVALAALGITLGARVLRRKDA
jgi:predicted MFS family arabinose efflux permease